MTSAASLPDVLLEHKAYTLIGTLSLIGLTALMFYPSVVLRWIQRKRYQYEVTFSLYMLTPTEKFIFNSILFLFLAMVSIAASLYLPAHIATVTRRAYWYALGDAEAVNASAGLVPTSVADLTQAVKDNLGAVSASVHAGGSKVAGYMASSVLGSTVGAESGTDQD